MKSKREIQEIQEIQQFDENEYWAQEEQNKEECLEIQEELEQERFQVRFEPNQDDIESLEKYENFLDDNH